MTKREICERLIDLRDEALNSLGQRRVAIALRDLILDLAAPEEEEPRHAQCVERNPVSPFDRLIPAGDVFAVYRCPICGEFSAKPTASGKLYCKKCNEEIDPACFHRPPVAAPETEKPKAEEKHPGVIAKPGKDGGIEWCWCQKCYAQAAVVHNPFGDGEDWSYCQKCGVSFRLKRGEGEEK